MSRPKHQAFLDLEETLAARLRNAWSRYWTPLSREVLNLCSQGRFDAAHRLAESIDLAPLFDRSRTFARTVGMSALLLGASRLRSPRQSRVAKQPPLRELDSFLRQTEAMLARNASQALRQMAHEWVAQEEAKLMKFDPSQPRHPKGTEEGGRWVDLQVETYTRSDGVSEMVIVKYPDNRGRLVAILDKGVLKVSASRVDDEYKSFGLGVRLYAKLADFAHERGVTLVSDETVSEEASRMYEALSRRGYTVTRNPAATYKEQYKEWWGKPVYTVSKADWHEEDHPRGKTTPESTPGSFISVTSTPEFKAWFAGSKVVDAEGKPLRVLHGSALLGEQTVFSDDGVVRASPTGAVLQMAGRNMRGFYFTDNPEHADFYADRASARGQSAVYPVYLSIKNPKYIDMHSSEWGANGHLTDDSVYALEAAGHDGVILTYKSKYDGRTTVHEYIALRPEQIKSVFNPRPTESPDILKSEVAKLDTGADRNQVKINVAGKNYFGLAASVQVSRMSAFGFLLEAAESGVTNYRVDAVLDERTCEVCRHMDGMVFPVEQGLQQAQLIMDTEDPEALKDIAPFYAQNKAALAQLGTYTIEDLIHEGMHLPPYHPLCRCILTPTDEKADLHPTQQADRIALASQTLYGEGDGVRLTRDLFGIEQPEEEAKRRLGDVVPDMTPEETKVMEWLQGVLEEPGYQFDNKLPPADEVADWVHEVVQDWLTQPSAGVPPAALITPTPFEGTTIPQEYARPFEPSRLAQLAQARWPWLAGILGWLALSRGLEPVPEDDPELVAEEELADEERDERNELREDRRP